MYRYLCSDQEGARVFKRIRLFFFGIVVILIAWSLYFATSTIIMPYQIEYREGAAQVMTQILLTGGNPFSLEFQPLGMNNYGVVYNVITLPFAKLFGNTLTVHRSVSFFFIVASALLVARIIWILNKNSLISILGGLFIAVILTGRGGLGAFPSSTGTFLFLSAILIPFVYSFHYPSLIVSALLSIVAYYTKPYFVIGFAVVAVYTFMFISKQRGIVYSLFFLSVFGIFFLGVRYVFSLYFIDTFLSNLSNASRSPEHLRKQLLELGTEFYPGILVGIALLFFNLSKITPANMFQKGFLSRSGFLQLDAPLINTPINYFTFTFISCLLGFVSVLGLHMGSYMTSAYQIVLPPSILWLFQTLNPKRRLSIIALCLLFGNILMLDNLLLHPAFLRQSDSAAWRDLYHHVSNSRRVVNSPVVVSALIDTGIPPVDSGQTEYYYSLKPYSDNTLVGPSYESIRRNGINYRRSVQNAIKSHKFDKIFTTEGYGNLIAIDFVSQYYIQVDTLTIDMPQTSQTWVIGVWEPKGK